MVAAADGAHLGAGLALDIGVHGASHPEVLTQHARGGILDRASVGERPERGVEAHEERLPRLALAQRPLRPAPLDEVCGPADVKRQAVKVLVARAVG